jgi:ubiquinone/menaquinone biosynthesis C-methylase UbiE
LARVYYYENDPLKTAESIARYEFARAYVEKGIVLDIGCGARKGPFILAQSARDVVGSDVSVEAVSYCARHWRGRNLRYAACDASLLSFGDGVFDAVLAFEVLEHVHEQEEFLKESRRVLKNNGVCVLSTPNKRVMSPDGVPQNPDHVRELTLPELRDLLSGVFGRVDLYGQKPSRKVDDVLATRRRSYQSVARIPVFLRRLFPKAARQALFEAYVKSRQGDIDERDFPVSKDSLEEAHYLIAVCGK